MVWLAVSLALSLPLLRYVDAFTGNYQSGVSFGLLDATNVAMMLAASVLLLPLAGIQVAVALQKWNKIDMFVSFCSVLGIILALVISMPDQNQYKFHYPLAMLLALSSLMCVVRWKGRGKTRWGPVLRIYLAVVVILALLNSAFGLHYAANRAISRYGQGRFEGIHVLMDDELDRRMSSYYWIRDYTAREAVVVVPSRHSTFSPLFHERLNYVKTKQGYYADNIAAYDLRINELSAFYDPSTPLAAYDSLLQSMESQLPGRPFYAVVEFSAISPAQMRERGARQVYDSPA